MSAVLSRRHSELRVSGGFGYLMDLYADNFVRLCAMFDPERLACGSYRSDSGDGLDLFLTVSERAPYTLFLTLTHRFVGASGEEEVPCAHVRLYRDARLAEVTHCYAGRSLMDVLGVFPDPRTLLGHRQRMNSFFNRWLSYLGERGHGLHSLSVCVESDPAQPQFEFDLD